MLKFLNISMITFIQKMFFLRIVDLYYDFYQLLTNSYPKVIKSPDHR